MRYTLLRLTASGVVLSAYHRRRLGLDVALPHGRADAGAGAAFARFARDEEPGVFAAWVDEDGLLRTERRSDSVLHDDLPVRFVPSPLGDRRGPIPKPASPGPYDDVRLADCITLLTSRDGRELYEACRAAVLGWDGRRLVRPPADRPRVWSTAETAVAERLATRDAPLAVTDAMPLLLVNAVKGTCAVRTPGREAFPADVRREIETVLASRTEWPA